MRASAASIAQDAGRVESEIEAGLVAGTGVASGPIKSDTV
jgi:hypothetical protein